MNVIYHRLRRLYGILWCGASKQLTRKNTSNPLHDWWSRTMFDTVRWLDQLETKLWFSDRLFQTKYGRVKSKGEKVIANWLIDHNVRYVYEPRLRLGNVTLNPDFYLPAHDLYLEFWGMAKDPSYRLKMERKLRLYELCKIQVVSLYPRDLKRLDVVLAALVLASQRR